MSGESPSNSSSSPWRRALKTSVAALLLEVGFQAVDVMALETLVEAIQAYIWEAGRSSSSYAELAGRTHVMPSDVVMALIEMGLDIRGIPAHARRDNKTVFLPPAQSPTPGSSKILQVGDKRKHPPHIPDHLPPFPDPHTYIKTPSLRQPANEYQVVREKAASQKRDVEVGLTQFIAKTGATHSLFKDDKSAFPLIACKPTPLPYLSALLPKDSDLDNQEETEQSEKPVLQKQAGDDLPLMSSGNTSTDPLSDGDTIDNPYLCPVKMARKNGRW